MPKNSLLTESQREFLQLSEEERKEQYTKQQRSYHRKETRERIEQGISDLGFLANHLDLEERHEIFRVKWGSDRQYQLERDLSEAIRLIYSGMDSFAWFDRILKDGVRKGEADRTDVEHPLHLDVKFKVSRAPTQNLEVTANRIKNDEWEDITAADLLGYMKSMKEGTGSFDAVELMEEYKQTSKLMNEDSEE